MPAYRRLKKTILVASTSSSDTYELCEALLSDRYRLLCAEGLFSLISSLDRYSVDMLVVDAELPGVSMTDFLPFIRERYGEIKIILTRKEYSAELELALRPHKILYMLTFPVNRELLRSIVKRGLALDVERALSA